MKFRTIIYGSFDQPEVFTAHDELGDIIKIDKELLEYQTYKNGDKEDFLRFPFYCEVRRATSGEQVAHKCFMYSYDALKYANMEIDVLEHEIHELLEQRSSNQIL